mmetsp:Transcript_2598/g.8726  ORF Transcript_2598/g.8726 Transcript_2598/m.8726 type:complete len:313 (+) Transcript_2598:162-1100(+)
MPWLLALLALVPVAVADWISVHGICQVPSDLEEETRAAQGTCPVPAVGLGLIQQERKLAHARFEDTAADGEDDAGARAAKSRKAGGVSGTKCAAEFIAMALFVFIGCGSAMSVANEPGWVLQVSLTFGFAITALAYAVGHYSGGQINCAVTLGLMLSGDVSFGQGLANVLSQLLGSVLGAAVLKFAYPCEKDLTGGLGTNGVSEGWSKAGALVAEFVGTFLLMFVVFETAVNPENKANSELAPVAIGLAVFLAHSVLIPIDGCSINPTRSFGPALVQAFTGAEGNPFRDMWIFWVGPLAGATAAACLYTMMH